ncbi:MAG: competence protein ComEA [Microbacteriaceae bacterium]|nr:competence protein ComEA [Microbacteriaceae bacterium]
MDPLLAKLLPSGASRGRRIAVLACAAAALAVLVIAVAVAAAGGSGTEVRVTAGSAARPSVASPTPVLVQVTGAVRRPGLVAVPSSARAIDAIAAAGGTTPTADESEVNLAAHVIDGQHLVVPDRRAGPAPGGTATAAPGAPISLGTASQAQLETLPRIGPAMAARIIAWRAANGGFRSVDDLLKVGGIGPKTLAGLKDLVTP